MRGFRHRGPLQQVYSENSP